VARALQASPWLRGVAAAALLRQAEGYTPANRDIVTSLEVADWPSGVYVFTLYAGTYHRSLRFQVAH
jgi:hypothetical protein